MKLKESKEHEAIQTTKPVPYIQGPGTHHMHSEMVDDEGGKYGEQGTEDIEGSYNRVLNSKAGNNQKQQ